MTAVITGTYSDAVITESLACGAVECLFKSEAKELFLARLASLARTVRDRQAVDAERRRLQGILSSVGDGVYGVDGDGTIQFINPAAVDLLGYADAEEVIGRNASDVVHPSQDDGTPLPPNATWSAVLPSQRKVMCRPVITNSNGPLPGSPKIAMF